eukprot:scaffold2727_cov140-Isochrysis_galbana.AAC.1
MGRRAHSTTRANRLVLCAAPGNQCCTRTGSPRGGNRPQRPGASSRAPRHRTLPCHCRPRASVLAPRPHAAFRPPWGRWRYRWRWCRERRSRSRPAQSRRGRPRTPPCGPRTAAAVREGRRVRSLGR